jgi:ribosomal protein S27E
MEPAHSLRKPGFRRWYERQLPESHASLVTCFLCGLGVAALLEGSGLRAPGPEPILRLVLAYASGLIGWHAWRRYRVLMARAQRISEQLTCPVCGTTGRCSVEPGSPQWRVRCRKCGNAWTIEQGRARSGRIAIRRLRPASRSARLDDCSPGYCFL